MFFTVLTAPTPRYYQEFGYGLVEVDGAHMLRFTFFKSLSNEYEDWFVIQK